MEDFQPVALFGENDPGNHILAIRNLFVEFPVLCQDLSGMQVQNLPYTVVVPMSTAMAKLRSEVSPASMLMIRFLPCGDWGFDRSDGWSPSRIPREPGPQNQRPPLKYRQAGIPVPGPHMEDQTNKPGTPGLRHILQAANYSFKGLKAALNYEEASAWNSPHSCTPTLCLLSWTKRS